MPTLTARRLATAGAVAVAGALLTAPAALAGTASVQDGVAHFQAHAGEVNRLSVSESPHPTNPLLKVVTFRDVEPVDAARGCVTDSTFSASCNVAASTTFVRTSLGNLADVLASASLATLGLDAAGDAGDDRLSGSGRRDVLEGGPGEDQINGGAGDDYIHAGIHDDRVTGGPGRDTLIGYYGDDTIDADDDAPGDEINCGPGFDKAIFNPGDTVNTNCELLQIG